MCVLFIWYNYIWYIDVLYSGIYPVDFILFGMYDFSTSEFILEYSRNYYRYNYEKVVYCIQFQVIQDRTYPYLNFLSPERTDYGDALKENQIFEDVMWMITYHLAFSYFAHFGAIFKLFFEVLVHL